MAVCLASVASCKACRANRRGGLPCAESRGERRRGERRLPKQAGVHDRRSRVNDGKEQEVQTDLERIICVLVCISLRVHALLFMHPCLIMCICGHLCVFPARSACSVCVLPADRCSSVVYSSLWIARVYMLKGYINHWRRGVKIDRLG